MSASTYTEREKTIVRVYFLHGASEQTIADLCRSYGFAPNTKGKVSGIVNREKLRNLSDRDRQARLDEIRAGQSPLQGIPEFAFKIIPRDGRGGRSEPDRVSIQPPAIAPNVRASYAGPPTREQFERGQGYKRRQGVPAKKAAPGEAGREGRARIRHVKVMKDPGGGQRAVTLDLRMGVVEYLEESRDIDQPVNRKASDAEKVQARAIGNIRRRAARILRDIHDAANGSPLSSPDWLKEPTGNAAGPMMLSASRLEALDVLGEMRKVIPADSMQEIEREIFSDQFGFLTHKSKLARAQAIDDLRRALDWAALVLFAGREVTINDMLDRWEEVRRDKLRHAVEWARRLNNGIPAE